jgi:hypothetical protein
VKRIEFEVVPAKVAPPEDPYLCAIVGVGHSLRAAGEDAYSTFVEMCHPETMIASMSAVYQEILKLSEDVVPGGTLVSLRWHSIEVN